MSQPFLGQIQPFGFNYAPRGWALCNGQILSIAQFTALFALIGTSYGGDGRTTFALPNLQSRVPMHFGTSPAGENYVLGEEAGEESVLLALAEMPAHSHSFSGTSSGADSKRPVTGSAYAQTTGDNFYAPAGSPTLTALNPSSLALAGSSNRHNNLQPFLTISWCICLAGIFPSRN